MRALLFTAATAIAGCGTAPNGRTGDLFVDACLHWTACITPPPLLAPSATGDDPGCVMGLVSGQGRLPWNGGGVAVTPAQLDCFAAAGLDCTQALDCVSTAVASCPSPAWTCNGDTVSRCDGFAGARVVEEDCGANGLHCLQIGDEAFCGAAACDPTMPAGSCMGQSALACQPVSSGDGKTIGGVIVPVEDCAMEDGECVGNGPACSNVGVEGCDGAFLVSCDASGHEQRLDCSALGMQCVMLTPNQAGIEYACSTKPGGIACEEGATFGQCSGTVIDFCDEQGNASVDCRALGYRDCADGHCVP